MTDIKLDETDGSHGESMAVELTANRWLDWTARAAVVVVFTALVVIGVAGIPRLLPLDSIHKLPMVAGQHCQCRVLKHGRINNVDRWVTRDRVGASLYTRRGGSAGGLFNQYDAGPSVYSLCDR